jgi:hypothetical protein
VAKSRGRSYSCFWSKSDVVVTGRLLRNNVDCLYAPSATRLVTETSDLSISGVRAPPLSDSIQRDLVTSLYRARRGNHSVNASAGELTKFTELDPVMANEGPKNVGILWQVILGKGRHHAPGIEQRNVEFCAISEPKRMPNPVVLDETRSLRLQNYVHPKPAQIEAGLGL